MSEASVILVVEDEELVRMLAVQVLEDAGYEVAEAARGREALEFLQQDRPIDLLFVDVGLPGDLDGFDLARQAAELRPGLKVLYATGYSEGGGRMVENGRMLAKPYRPGQLEAEVASMLGA